MARFYTSTQGNEAIALNRLHGIISDRIRNQIASRTLAEVVSEQRVTTMKAVAEAANLASEEFGIEVVDVRIKSIELPDDSPFNEGVDIDIFLLRGQHQLR